MRVCGGGTGRRQAVEAACEQTRYSDELYVAGEQCGRSYVVCQSGSAVYAGTCPPGTRLHLDQRTCVDQQLCARLQGDTFTRQQRRRVQYIR